MNTRNRRTWTQIFPVIALVLIWALAAGLPEPQAKDQKGFETPNIPCGKNTKVRRFHNKETGKVVITILTYTGKIIQGVEDGERFANDFLKEQCKKLAQASSASLQQLAAAQFPVDVAVDDFNGDGNVDVAIANQDSSNVSIFLGNAAGTFGNPVEYPTGTGPQRIKAGDFNNDDKIDLVTANIGSGLAGDVSILLGNGNGSFQPPVSISMGTQPADVAVGDFNKDGKLDLAAADYSTVAVIVRLGNGDGTFQAPITLSIPQAAQSLVVDDMNKDGNPDIITAGAILLGNGNGTFQPAINFVEVLGANPLHVATGDLNGDNKPDVVVTSGGSQIVSVLLGNGDGTLQPPRHYVAGNTPEEVFIIDFDGVGGVDLLIPNISDDHLSVFPGNGDGTFQAAPAYPTISNLSNRSGASDAATADFTGDGIPDVVAANGGNVVLLPGLGAGALGPAAAIPGLAGSQVIAGDWNGDGKQDLAFTMTGPSRLSVVLGNGNGTFGAPTNYPLPGSDSFDDFLAAAFVNADNIPDLLVANTGTGTISVFLGNGSGGFTEQPAVPVGTFPNSIATGDLNNDGKLDLAVTNLGSFGALNGSVQVMLGNGDGTFQAPQTVRSNVEADSVVIADFNRDDKLDLAAVVQSTLFDWDIEIFLGKGDGTFAAPKPLGLTQDLVHGLRVADFDQDGIPDLAVSLEGTQAAVFRGKGDGTFEPPVFVDVGGGTVVAADLDQDSLPDIVSPSEIGSVAVLINGGNGQPGPGAQPDLIVSTFEGPATAITGKKVTFSYAVQNQGTVDAGRFKVDFFLSTDNGITREDRRLAGKSFSRGLPAGGSTGSTSLSITIPRDAVPGSYFIGAIVDPENVVSESDESNNTNSFPITLCNTLLKPSLLSPASRATGLSSTPALDWSDVNGASAYEVQVATDSRFTNIVATQTSLTLSEWTVTPALSGSATYYWRVRAFSPCGPGPYSANRSFKTGQP
jgi:hypothetical protein